MSQYGKLIHSTSGDGEQEFSLQKSAVEIGRATQNDIVLIDEKVSRSHARIECSSDGCTLIDLDSANGTKVNGIQIKRTELKPGDVIALGSNNLRYEWVTPRAEPEVTLLNTISDLDNTLAKTVLETSLNDVSQPRIVIHTSEKTWEANLKGDSLTIGRDPANDVIIDDIRLSRHHARFQRKGNIFVIKDLESTNGTWFGDDRIDEHMLEDGDTMRIGNANIVFKSGFQAHDLTMAGIPEQEKPSDRNPVVIVPGLMGSQLWRGSERVWPNVKYLFSRPDSFRLPEFEPLEARGLVGEVVIVPNLIKQEQYNRLGDYLEDSLDYEREKDLMEFAYDWRQDVRESSKKLAEAVDNWHASPPITIIAHSLGCLVSRYYIECLGGKDKVGRVVLLGGPHAGVPHAIASLHTGPDLLPFGLLGERLREVLITFPSMYQLLPTYACVIDQDGKYINLLENEFWLPEAQRPLLQMARDFRRELGDTSSVPAVSIFGYGIKTVTQVLVNRDKSGTWKSANLTTETSGDNRIPESSGVLRGTEIHPVEQHHGALYVDNDVKMRLKMELTR
jgi:pSer/pThr/pTyr-binding forkhead associated (FHA) protein